MRPKNVIWITTDHQRFDCIEAHGNKEIHTPNMDRLIRGGVSFSNAIVQSPVCMPSRCSFMTGLYPQQNGVTWNGGSLPDDFHPSVARLMGGIGYQTTQIGKLHFEPHEDLDLDPKPRNRYGFDTFYCSEEPGCYQDPYRIWLGTEFPEYLQALQIERSSSPNRPRLNNPVAGYEGKVVDAPWQASYSGWVSQMACNFMAQRHRRQAHQFMHMGFYAPHPPLNPTTEMFEPYKGADIAAPHFEGADRATGNLSEDLWNAERLTEYKRYFYAMTTGVDFAIGQLLDQLEKIGELNDTLIILNSDHGDACGDHFCLEKYYNLFYDGVVRVPLVFHWPKGIPARKECDDSMIELIDILPTMMDLCDSVCPDVLMGQSVASALRDGVSPQKRSETLTYSHDLDGPHALITSKDFKYIHSGATERLWDIRGGTQREDVDVAQKLPDVTAEYRERMLTRMLAAGRSYRDHHKLF